MSCVGVVCFHFLHFSIWHCFHFLVDALGDLLEFAAAVDFGEEAALAVVFDDGLGAAVVGGEPRLGGFGGVVVALVKGGAAAVAGVFARGRAEEEVIGGFAFRADAAAGEAGQKFVIRDAQVDGASEGAAHATENPGEGAGLVEGAGEAIQQAALGGRNVGQAGFDHFVGDEVGGKFAAVNEAAREDAEGGAKAHVFPVKLAGRDVLEGVFTLEEFGLSSFAGARPAQ